MSQDAWMETTPIGADFPHPAAVAAVTFYFVFFLHLHLLPLRFLKQRGGGGGGASLFRILLLLRASSHFYPFPPSPTPDSSLYRCSHKSHNAPVIITPTPVYLQPVAWRGASLSLSRCLLLSLSPPPLLLCSPFLFSSSSPLLSFFFSCRFPFYSLVLCPFMFYSTGIKPWNLTTNCSVEAPLLLHFLKWKTIRNVEC